MIFTMNWLKKYLNTEATVTNIVDTLNNIGFEVENIDNIFERYDQFKVAQIKSYQPHLDATKLNICTVDDGEQELQVVCGASNVKANMKVVLAPVNSVIPFNNMVIKSSNIRGVNSNGMLCSAQELNLDPSSELHNDGIIELPAYAKVGESFAIYYGLDDIVIDISVTPNRGDALSIYGIARDLAAAGLGELISPYSLLEASDGYQPFHHNLHEECGFITLHRLNGVFNGKSPDFIKRYLNKINQSSKNALVDISNFAMFDLGHPNHIYDADKIVGEIKIRRSYDNEIFIGLNDIEYTLPEGLLVIADDNKIIAVAGVMGARDSKVDDNTKNIIVEVAIFNPAEVAHSGRILNLHSESRYRFERRVDEGDLLHFAQYLVNLIQRYCQGSIINRIAFISEIKASSLYLDYDKIYSIIGFHIAQKDIDTVLNKLGFKIEDSQILIPTYRAYTVNNIADIAEEILRIFGYKHLPSIRMPAIHVASQKKKEIFIPELRQKIADNLCMHEVISWSFMSDQDLPAFGFKADVRVNNPISSELNVMRPILLPNLLQICKENVARLNIDFSVFECGHVFRANEEELVITGVRLGYASRTNVHQNMRKYDFYDVKADVWKLLEMFNININSVTQTNDVPEYYHPARALEVKLGNKRVAYLGEVHPLLLEKYNIKEPCVVFEFFPDNLPPISCNIQYGKTLPDLQPICRDFAFLVKEEVNFEDISNAISKLRHKLIHKIELFDIYRDEKMSTHHKSVAIRVWLQSVLHTLVDNEITEVSDSIIQAVQAKTGGELRK